MRASALLHAVIGASITIGMEAVDNSGSEVAGRDLLLEEDIKLGVGAALGLGQAEESPYEAEEASASVEETGLSAPVLWIVSGGSSNSNGVDLPMLQGSTCEE